MIYSLLREEGIEPGDNWRNVRRRYVRTRDGRVLIILDRIVVTEWYACSSLKRNYKRRDSKGTLCLITNRGGGKSNRPILSFERSSRFAPKIPRACSEQDIPVRATGRSSKKRRGLRKQEEGN